MCSALLTDGIQGIFDLIGHGLGQEQIIQCQNDKNVIQSQAEVSNNKRGPTETVSSIRLLREANNGATKGTTSRPTIAQLWPVLQKVRNRPDDVWLRAREPAGKRDDVRAKPPPSSHLATSSL